MKRIKLLIIAVMAVLGVITPVSAVARQNVADSLMNQLKFRKTASDSLKLLYDVFDVSLQSSKAKSGRMLLELAKHTDNQAVLIDVIPQMAVLLKLDSLMPAKLNVYADLIKNPDHKEAVKIFIDVVRASVEANYIPESELREVLLKYAGEDMIPKNNRYEDILDLYRMVIFLGTTTHGNLYLEYLDRLDNMIVELPEEFNYLRNLYYTTAANVYTRNQNYKKAIEADKKLIEVIGKLDATYKKMGRSYRNYDRFYYISYRRMLGNYQGLTLDEIKDIYSKCAVLAENDREVAYDFYGEGRPTIYRLMAIGDYEGAVPRLKKALPLVKDNFTRRNLMSMLVTAADSIKDEATLLEALKEYNVMLREAIDEKSAEAYRELQIRYDVNQLKTEKETLEFEKKEVEVATGQRVISVALAALLIFAVLLMVLYRSNFTLKRKIRDMQKDNLGLHRTIESILDESTNLPGTLDVREGKPSDKGNS